MVVTSAQYVTDDKNNNTCIKSTINGIEMFVPMDTYNLHYQAILKWVDAGNNIKAAD